MRNCKYSFLANIHTNTTQRLHISFAPFSPCLTILKPLLKSYVRNSFPPMYTVYCTTDGSTVHLRMSYNLLSSLARWNCIPKQANGRLNHTSQCPEIECFGRGMYYRVRTRRILICLRKSRTDYVPSLVDLHHTVLLPCVLYSTWIPPSASPTYPLNPSWAHMLVSGHELFPLCSGINQFHTERGVTPDMSPSVHRTAGRLLKYNVKVCTVG